jgi:hypothetical protein
MTESFDPRVTPWHIDHAEFYELESFEEQMRFLLQYAILAPSGHNTQPWAFRVTKEGVEVFADYTRRLLAVDPGDRELLMSVGAAITNFRVAAAHFGFGTTVTYDRRPEEGVPVAFISLCETCAPDGSLVSLFRAIPERHTNRAPFDGQPLEPDRLARICDLLDHFPDTLRVLLSQHKERVAEMVEEGDHLLMAGGTPLERLYVTAWQGRRDRRLARTSSALLLVTAEDDRVSLIRAGEVLELLLLTITATGLQYSFLNQPVAADPLRTTIGSLAGTPHPPQLLIRIGAAPPVEEPRPRRPLEHVIATAG